MLHRLVLVAALIVLPSVHLAAQDPETAPTRDIVTLRSGDRLSGTVKSITADKVVLESPSYETVEIPTLDVASVTTAGAVKIETGDGQVLEMPVQGMDGGNLRIGSGGAVREVAVADLVDVTPPATWSGSFNVGAAMATGNTNRRSANAAFDISRKAEDNRFNAKATWDYAEEKSTVADSNGSTSRDYRLAQRRVYGRGQYDYLFNDRLYSYGMASGEYDAISNLDLRLIVGVGAGYTWLDEEDLTFSTEAGVNYVDENRNQNRSPTSVDSEYVAARGALSLRWQVADDVLLLHDSEIFPSLEDSSDVNARADTRLRTTLAEDLFAQLQWIFDYDNTPAPGLEREDHRLLLTVGWSF